MASMTTANVTPAASSSSPYVPLNVMDYLTPIAARRYPSPLRSLQPLLAIPGMISLGAGLPNPANFPFENITVTFKDGAQASLTPSELNASLQYGTTSGFPELVEILVAMQRQYHKPTLPADSWGLSVTTGSQEGLFKVIEMLVAPGDAIIVELPTYSGAIACLRPLGCRFVGVPIDADGMQTDELERVLSTWNVAEQGRKPRVVYVIPVGHNPGGTSMSESRKRHLLRLAHKHDLIVLEDDPYYFLNYGVKPAPERDDEFQPVHAPSLWSLDTHGRVIRFDSLSKVLSSGIRLGFVTGPVAFVHRLNLNTESSNLMVSGVAQVLALKYFQKVGPSGWDAHVNRVALFYMRRRDAMIAMCKELLSGLATWNVPAAGMFLWLHLDGVRDSRALIEEKARTHGVILVPGYIFYPDPAHESSHVRASFSLATLENMRLALERFAALLKAERESKK